MARSNTGGAFMTPFLQSKFDKLRNQLSDRFLEFQPYIKMLPIEGCPIRFFYATAQAASWYDPLKEKNRRELEWLIANIAPEGQKIIDAGAYHGLYATVLARAAGDEGEVVAVDPVPSNQAVIEVNFAINGLRGRVERCVVSNTDGEVGFSARSCGHIVERGGIRCPSRRLRSILPGATIVKLDIEGAEFDVVPAQIDDLPAARVWIVEIHPGRGRDPATVLDAFRTRPFDLWWGHPISGQFERYAGEPWTVRTTLLAIRRS
jgi:FkbM family methyltransferase